MFRELTDDEARDLVDQGYGWSYFMGGFSGKRGDAIIISAGNKNYLVDDFNCEEYQELLCEQEAEAEDYQDYLEEIGYGN